MWLHPDEKVDYWRKISFFTCPCFVEGKYRIIECPWTDIQSEVFNYEEYHRLSFAEQENWVFPTWRQKMLLFRESIEAMIEDMKRFTKFRVIPVVSYTPVMGEIRSNVLKLLLKDEQKDGSRVRVFVECRFCDEIISAYDEVPTCNNSTCRVKLQEMNII